MNNEQIKVKLRSNTVYLDSSYGYKNMYHDQRLSQNF